MKILLLITSALFALAGATRADSLVVKGSDTSHPEWLTKV